MKPVESEGEEIIPNLNLKNVPTSKFSYVEQFSLLLFTRFSARDKGLVLPTKIVKLNIQ